MGKAAATIKNTPIPANGGPVNWTQLTPDFLPKPLPDGLYLRARLQKPKLFGGFEEVKPATVLLTPLANP